MARLVSASVNAFGFPAFTWRVTPSFGTISVWLKPVGWSSTGVHVFWSADSVSADPTFQRFSDNNVYVGFQTAPNTRMVFDATGLFSDGVWANWIFTWSTARTTQEIYKNGIFKSSSACTSTNFSSGVGLNIGNYAGGSSADSSSAFADFAYWSRVLTPQEIFLIAYGARRANTVASDSLIFYAPLASDSFVYDLGLFKDVLGTLNGGTGTGTPVEDLPFTFDTLIFEMPILRPPSYNPGASPFRLRFQITNESAFDLGDL